MLFCSSKFSQKGIVALVGSAFLLSSCGVKKQNGNARSYIPTLEEDTQDPGEMSGTDTLMRNLPNDDLRGYGACKWIGKVASNGGKGRFRMVEKVSVESKRFWEIWKKPIQYKDLFNSDNSLNFSHLTARSDIAANPLYMFALAYFTDQNIPNSAEFFKMFDERMFKNPIFFPGFLTIRALLSLGIINSIDQRNNEIKKEINKTFPGVFISADEGALKESILSPLIRNGTPRMTRLSPYADSSLTEKQRSDKYWAIMNRYVRPLPMFTSSSWKGYNDEIRTALSVAIDSWNSSDAEEQACANILFQRTQAQLLTLMGYDRLGFFEQNSSSSLYEVPDLLVARDATTFKVCPTAGSFVKRGRRAFITLNDFATDDAKRPAPIDITKGPYMEGPCTNPVPRTSSNYLNFQGEKLSTDKIGQGNDLIDFLSAVSQYVIALNPGAPWWEKRTYPLLNFTELDSLEKSNGIMPSISYALSLGLMYVSLEKILTRHLVMVDFNSKRTSNPDSALGIRISNTPDPKGLLKEIVTDAESALRITEIAYKGAETLDRLANWNYRQVRAIGNNSEAKRRYKDTIKGLFGSEKNLDMLVSTHKDGIRARLKQLQLASSLLLTKFAKKQSDGYYTCHTQLKSNLEEGTESAAGDCSKTAPRAEKLFKDMAKIMARRYNSPLFADFARKK